MGFYGSHCHLELGGDFGVVTTLQKQFNNLLFARTEPNGLLLHLIPPLSVVFALVRSGTRLTFSQNSFFVFPIIKRPIDYQSLGESTRVGRHRTTFAMSHYTGNLASADSSDRKPTVYEHRH
jgi:hypothetical protein